MDINIDNKVMIIGAGKFQVPIIEQAKKMGLFTIVVSIPGDYPGFSKADKFYEIDARDKEKILEIAVQENIRGILTDQTDISVPSVAYVAEKLGLPGVGYDCALRFTNKYVMRKFCEKMSIPVPRNFQSSSFQKAKKQARQLSFPIVVKPVDSQGSRGVRKINNVNEIYEKFSYAQSFSNSGYVVIEEYFSGREVVVQGFVSDYEFTNLVIGDRYYFNLDDMFIPSQTIFPSNLSNRLKQKVLNLNSKLIKSFMPKFGITHSEFLIDEKNENVCLVETSIRGGGVFISSDLIPLSCGINVNELLIRLAIGQNVKIDQKKLYHRAAAYLCFYLPEGIIRRISGVEKIKKMPEVYELHLQNVEIGEKSKPIKDKTSRLGPILVAGIDRESCQKAIKYIQETLKIDVETSRGIQGIQW